MNNLKLGRILLGLLSFIPKKYPMEGANKTLPPFFIVNSGRCGSTLLNRLLNQHQEIFMPSEQYFIHNLIIKFQLYNWLLWRDLGKILAGEIISSLETHTWELEEKNLFSEIVLAKGEDRSLHKIIDNIIKTYANQLNSSFKIWGDSTPLNQRYIREIYRAYPNAKYIYLVRDVRDVISSYKRKGNDVPFLPFTNHVQCAKSWVHTFEQSNWLKKRTPVLHVRYESLVSDTDHTINQIFSFLNVNAERINTRKVDVPKMSFYEASHHSNLKNPINTKSIGRWKNELNKEQINDIMPIIAKPMKKLNYLD